MRLLLVEDEKKLANACKKALSFHKYVVDIAYDGEEGLALARSEEYDLIILDRMLPKLDGIAVCKKLRHDGYKTPIVMLTAKGEISDRITGLDAGADDYMVKPFSLDELFSRIRALVRRSTNTTTTALRAQDLLLDSNAQLVKRKDTFIALSNKEFAILEYLLRHKNMVVSKEQLIAHIWNYDTSVLSNTVEVHMKHLRDKIHDSQTVEPTKRIITTVRGFGYCIKDTAHV